MSTTSTNRSPEVEGVAGLFLGLTWGTAVLRIYVRAVMAKNFGLEDWLAISALFLFTSTAVFALLGINESMGLPYKEVMAIAPQNYTPAMMWWFAVELSYVTATCVLKLSIGVFLLRIAVKEWHRICLYLTMGLVLLFSVGYLFFLVFQCSPVDFFWLQFSQKPGTCVNPDIVGALTYTHSGLNASADIILAFLPVHIVSQLHMNLRTKITVSLILSLGMIACIAVIIRIPYIKILVDNSHDFLYYSTDVVIWSAIEPGLAITAANMATLRPLFSVCLSRSKFWGTTNSRYKSSRYWSYKTGSGFSSRMRTAGKGYTRSRSTGNADAIGLGALCQNGTRTRETKCGACGADCDACGKPPVKSKLDTRIEEEALPQGSNWDIERQSGPNCEPAGEWPLMSSANGNDSDNDNSNPDGKIVKTVRTEIWSSYEFAGPLPTLPPEMYDQVLPGPPTDGRRDVWPDKRPGSSYARS
ncbi:hypothetical protein LZ554_008960 [Drepanopeziza brunnea f. sp. 'monogermtubi']|nr:hypothetical protein LZ554_008960 [Drepanopeziza brunnea f. sp. 'monogermtubi']